jgi:hypothetical protein
LISTHQNDLKTLKNINLKQRKKYKKLIFLKILLKYKNKQDFESSTSWLALFIKNNE